MNNLNEQINTLELHSESFNEFNGALLSNSYQFTSTLHFGRV